MSLYYMLLRVHVTYTARKTVIKKLKSLASRCLHNFAVFLDVFVPLYP